MNENATLCVEILRKAAHVSGIFDCRFCPVYAVCPAGTAGWNNECMFDTAANLIESLSEKLEQVTHERDAAIRQQLENDKNNPFACNFCKHDELCDGRLIACGDCDMDCPCNTCIDHDKWQWRGVEVEG